MGGMGVLKLGQERMRVREIPGLKTWEAHKDGCFDRQ